MAIVLFLVGPSSDAADRDHLLRLKQALEGLDSDPRYEVVLEMERADAHKTTDGKPDLLAIRADRTERVTDKMNLVVACVDGSSADTETMVDVVKAVEVTGAAVLYSTTDKPPTKYEPYARLAAGVSGIRFVHHRSSYVDGEGAKAHHAGLVQKIHEAIQKVRARQAEDLPE